MHEKPEKIRLDEQTLIESSQNNEPNIDETNAEKPFNSNKSAKLQIEASEISRNKKNQTDAQKA